METNIIGNTECDESARLSKTMRRYEPGPLVKLPCVVAINRFPQDTEAELKLVEDKCRELGVNVALSEVWAKGGEGGIELAKEVIRLCDQPNDFTFSYELDKPIKEKIRDIVTKIYHGDDVAFTPNAEKQIKTLTELGYDKMPICMAKTQYSFSRRITFTWSKLTI